VECVWSECGVCEEYMCAECVCVWSVCVGVCVCTGRRMGRREYEERMKEGRVVRRG